MNNEARKLLQRLARGFNTRHQGMVSKLDQYKVSVIELTDFSRSGMARGLSAAPTLEDILVDLRSSGHLKSVDSLSVSLTELGLREIRGYVLRPNRGRNQEMERSTAQMPERRLGLE